MMTERRYGFRFSGVEGGLLVGSVLLASFLIFVSGVYVGREVAGRKVVTHAPVVRAPVVFPPNPVVAKTTMPNDSLVMRTASPTAEPAVEPGEKAKAIPPVPVVARPEALRPVEKEKPALASLPARVPAIEATPRAVEVKPRRTEPAPSGSEGNGLARAKPQGEPFMPKLPTGVASRTEKRLLEMSARNETGEKKSTAVTVARIEKIETQIRIQKPAAETKRTVEAKEKDSEAKLPLAAVKKTTKPMAGWRVQVGATTFEETAHDMARELRELGYSPLVSKVQMNGETLYRVRIGKFNKQGEAAAAVGRFRREGRFSQAYLVSE